MIKIVVSKDKGGNPAIKQKVCQTDRGKVLKKRTQ